MFDDLRRNFLMNPQNGLKVKPLCCSINYKKVYLSARLVPFYHSLPNRQASLFVLFLVVNIAKEFLSDNVIIVSDS